MRRLLIAAAFALALIGCASGPKLTPDQSAFNIQARYITLTTIVLQYVKLPRCPAPVACSDLKALMALQAADQVAYDALREMEWARNGSDAALFAQQARIAISAFRAVLVRFAIQ